MWGFSLFIPFKTVKKGDIINLLSSSYSRVKSLRALKRRKHYKNLQIAVLQKIHYYKIK